MRQAAPRRALLLLALASLAVGCAPTAEPARLVAGQTAAPTLSDPVSQLARVGAAALADGDTARAQEAINTALKLNPASSPLHTLNALAYHAAAVNGDAAKFELAEAGYRIALDQDPGNWVAARQFGRLLLETDRCQEALAHLAVAVSIDPNDPDTLQRIAVCAWRTRDLKLARAAIDAAVRQGADGIEAGRAAALIAAGTGNRLEADRYVAALEQRPEASPDFLSDLKGKVARLHAVSSNAVATQDIAGALTVPAPAATAAGRDVVVGGQDPGPLPPQARFQSGAAMPSRTGSLTGGFSGGSSSSGLSLGGQEEVPLPALERPAAPDQVPLMAMFTVAIIRTTEAINDARGVNLLSQLTLNFNYQREYQRTFRGAAEDSVAVLRKGFALNPSSNILYSLNIANAAVDEAEVLARPTLVALDGVPSTFFSGSELSIALNGGIGGTGTLVQKPIGVALSVTPTFVDHDTVMLAVRASRQFLEFQTNSSPSLNQTLQTARNVVTANVALKFGETLVLSGLNEKETTRVKSGVPLLQDIPGLQYLFSTNRAEDFQRTVLILLTPRRPAFTSERGDTAELLQPEMEQKYRRLKRVLPEAFDPDSNVDAIVSALNGNIYFEQYRQGDVRAETWLNKADLADSVRRTLSYLYF